MKSLKIFTKDHLNSLLKLRENETKLGEHVVLTPFTNTYNAEIFKTNASYVILGISESIGINANLGYSKAYNTFGAAIKVLLNTQSNQLIHAKNIQILGHLEYPDYQNKLKDLDLNQPKNIKTIRKWVEEIDKDVTQIIHDIVKAGKIPIIIGGGHNNAYGNLKGTSLALNKPINAVNFDAHTDFRALEGRHSGNGFSYAMDDGFLNNYFIFGLHENYTSKLIFSEINSNKYMNYNTYEAIAIRKSISFKKAVLEAKNHVISKPFGLEIDCDAIENISSSAQTPSGFSVEKTRQFIHSFAEEKNVSYLHICEASCTKKNEKQVGKLISYFITDFIKSHSNNLNEEN